jgi:hypothetical protein
MKSTQKLTMLVIATTLAASTAYAQTIEVDFAFGTGGPFLCIVNGDPNAIVNIDTHNINLDGACKGPYVTRPGHLQMPASVVNTYYFEAVQNDPRTGNITIDAHANTLTCYIGSGGRPLFNTGGGNC